MAPPKSLRDLAVPLGLEPMKAKLVEHLPEGDWQYEPKWDGFRCLAFRAGEEVDLKAKSGKPLARYFPEMVETLKRVKPRAFVLDGESRIKLLAADGAPIPAGNGFVRFNPAHTRLYADDRLVE